MFASKVMPPSCGRMAAVGLLLCSRNMPDFEINTREQIKLDAYLKVTLARELLRVAEEVRRCAADMF